MGDPEELIELTVPDIDMPTVSADTAVVSETPVSIDVELTAPEADLPTAPTLGTDLYDPMDLHPDAIELAAAEADMPTVSVETAVVAEDPVSITVELAAPEADMPAVLLTSPIPPDSFQPIINCIW